MIGVKRTTLVDVKTVSSNFSLKQKQQAK